MDNSKYEAVRAKIVEACPDLMELSFGCRVDAIKGILKGTGAIITTSDLHTGIVINEDFSLFDCFNVRQHREVDTKFIFHHKDKFEILGHPIRLSHVLRAIAGKVDSTACMYPDGSFVEWDSSGDNYYTLFRYDLTKDDLSLQSPETIDFLFNILCE